MAGPPLPSELVPSWVPLWLLLILATAVASLYVLRVVARPRVEWGQRLRRRWVLGIPWGTVLTVLGVVCVYLFLQGGLQRPRTPLVIPFRSWSYFYPLGVLTASFSHANLGHVTGNLLGTLAFAPLVEYAWGHFPRERGSHSFGPRLQNPFVRIPAFVVGVFVVGMLSSAFSVGPVIGFSGVVFAFAGFALVNYPVGTVVALIATNVLEFLWQTFRNPIVTAEASPRFITPWWANVAIQGHILGLFLGVVIGGILLYQRDRRPTALRLWFGALGFAATQNLWALYWFRGNGKYVLFRGAGAMFILALSALIVAAVRASDEPLVDTLDLSRLGIDRSITVDLRRREVPIGIFLAFTLAIALAAVPVNLATVGNASLEDGATVRDYEVTYDENVPNEYSSIVDVSALGVSTQFNTSGVIVVSRQRQVFQTIIQKSQLRFQGRGSVRVGGVGWSRVVRINHTGWNAAGNGTVYKVFVNPPDGERELTYTSQPRTVQPRIAHRRIELQPANVSYRLVVSRNGSTVGRTRLPTAGSNVTAGGITFNRTNGDMFALRDGTRVKIASESKGQRER